MKYKRYIIAIGIIFFIILPIFMPWQEMKNPERPIFNNSWEGSFITVRDGTKIFIYEYIPPHGYKSTIFIISGITGINHNNEKDIIEKLSDNKNRIVIIHPRGAWYSEGKRGDISNFSDFIEDYIEIIKRDISYQDSKQKIILYGHSMSCAFALAIADKLQKIDGIILINPPYKQKTAKWMSPSVWDYLKYVGYYIFAPHIPIVNMVGEPSEIENEEDKKDSEIRIHDPLLVKYFSIYMMIKSREIMNSMIKYSQKADYPLLLIYGTKDTIVDKAGCDLIYKSWKNKNKKYEIIKNGSHGKSTVLKAAKSIIDWINEIEDIPITK